MLIAWDANAMRKSELLAMGGGCANLNYRKNMKI